MRRPGNQWTVKSLWDKFWERVDADGDCWVWTGTVRKNGYGYVYITQGEERTAHRVAYELLVGPIPEKMVPDHLCRNRVCVNLDHLEIVTELENALRGIRGRRTVCFAGHPYENPIINHGRRYCRVCRNARRRERRATREHPVRT